MNAKVNIATARIKGLNVLPIYYPSKWYWGWGIRLFDTSSKYLEHFILIKVGDTKGKAISLYIKLKKRFKQANIFDGDKVVILYGADGNVRAIGSCGRDSWIDVNDEFVIKTFRRLDINITSLKVY